MRTSRESGVSRRSVKRGQLESCKCVKTGVLVDSAAETYRMELGVEAVADMFVPMDSTRCSHKAPT